MNERKDEAKAAIYELLEKSHAVMLGAEGAGEFMQPMAPQFDSDSPTNSGKRDIWFFTKSDTDLAKASVTPVRSSMCLMGGESGTYACISGILSVDYNEEIIEKFWSPIVGAWFDGGKTDPKLTMLRFNPHKASVWVNESSAAKFGFEIAKANLFNVAPDLGFQKILEF